MNGDQRLSKTARDLINNPDNDVYVSAASAWEIATKFAKGRLPAASVILPDFNRMLAQEDFIELPITSAHMVRSAFLPGQHNDPFDRILAAQSILEGMPLISVDSEIPSLGVPTRW